jgi:hypothetical protein
MVVIAAVKAAVAKRSMIDSDTGIFQGRILMN